MASPDLDLDLIRCFIAVVEFGGFTAAGKRLNLTQSAISLKIQRLETLLGRRIFTRTSRSLELTTEGELLWSYARLLEMSEEMIGRITAPAVSGVLNLGVVEYFVPHLLPNLLSRYAKAHPDVLLNVEVGLSRPLFDGLEEGRLDLIIASSGEQLESSRLKNSSQHRRPLMRERVVWIKSESFELPKTGEPLRLALLPQTCRYRLLAIDTLERMGRPWRQVYSSASLASILAAVRAGLAVSIICRSSVPPGVQILTEADGFPPLPDSEVAIFSRQSLDKPLTRCLSEFFIQAVEASTDLLFPRQELIP